MYSRKNRSAFTLIELLVVIAIIAILAAILFPVFAQARESARSSSCLSNTKQVSLGILQYLQDYDERFPIWVHNINGDPNAAGATTPTPRQADRPWGPWPLVHIGWDHAVQPYVKNAQVFRCPSAQDGVDTNASGDDSKPTGANNYYLNARLAGRNDGNSNTAKLAQVQFPAVTILIGETSRAGGNGNIQCDLNWLEWGWQGGHAHKLNGDNNADSGWDENSYNADKNALCHQGTGSEWGEGAALRRHKGGGNYAFIDGHSKFYTGDATCVIWDRSGSPPRNVSGQTITYIP